MKPVDILAIGVHPDDVELCAGGTVISHVKQGASVALLDLTEGELGTRGTAEIRLQEAQDAAKIMGVEHRINLGFSDGFFKNDEQHQREVVKAIRHFRPRIILANALEDRHPDHGRAAQLVRDSMFLAGLRKVETLWEGKEQEAWKADVIYHYVQSKYSTPDIAVDISEHMDQKMEAILAYRSQFYDPNSDEPDTYISSPEFLDYVKASSQVIGKLMGVKYAEGFHVFRYPGVKDLRELI